MQSGKDIIERNTSAMRHSHDCHLFSREHSLLKNLNTKPVRADDN